MILHYATGSAHSAAVRIALAEKGLTCELRRLDLARFEQHSASFLALGCGGMVPLLEHDGHALSGTFPILLYLDEVFSEHRLTGDDANEHYRVQKWGKYVETHIAPNLAMVRWHALKGRVPEAARAGIERLPRVRRDLWRQAAEGFGKERLAGAAQALRTAGERLAVDLAGSDWLAGSSLTLADIAAYPHVAQFPTLGLALPEAVEAWLGRMECRPSVAAIANDLYPLATMGPEAGRWG